MAIFVRLVKLTRSWAPSESITCQSSPQMTSRPRVLRQTSSCSLTPPNCCRSPGSYLSLPVLRRWEAGEDVVVGVEVEGVPVEEEAASEEEGVVEASTEGEEEDLEGAEEVEASEEGVEDKFACCLCLIFNFFSDHKIS